MKRYKKKRSLAVIILAFPIIFCVVFALFKWGIRGAVVTSTTVKSFQEIKKAAEQGEAKSEFNLGNAYKYGLGVPVNDGEAVRWFRKSADQGDAMAQCSLGVAYILGKGVEANEGTAVEWFRKSADQGDVLAQNNLGNAYYFGRGVKKDVQIAYEWFLLASNGGNSKASEMLASIEDLLTPDEKLAARNWARQWKPKPAQ